MTPAERSRLLKFGRLVGPAIRELISIVHPRTFARWVREQHPRKQPVRRGRPRTKQVIRELILRLALENDWGYTRIKGELVKLGLPHVGRTTIQNVLQEAGYDPGPHRGPTTWNDFVTRHAQTLWACDFLSVRGWTATGLKDIFVLFFIHVQTRRVWVSPCTLHPTGQWIAQQARNFLMHVDDVGLAATHLIRDRDRKFTDLFDTVLKSEGVEVVKLPARSPNLNAYAERFVQTIKQECLDHFWILGQKHLDYLVHEFLEHYHVRRPHQAKGNRPLIGPTDEQPPPLIDDSTLTDGSLAIGCEERLGGFLRHYYRQAA